tara:strand:+ start:459 stop:800 length:342 start_codon:yes stop_codon:yes gene_type:complete
MFSKLYFDSTAPETEYSRLISFDVLLSIIVHVIFYTLFLFLFSFIFNIKFSKNTYMKFIIALIVLMTLGYPARLARVKSLQNTLVDYGFDTKAARHIAVSIINNGYFTWFFLG